MPQTNPAGRALIEEFEGCELTAYQDSGGIWTIGYGHTGSDVRAGDVITRQEADALLANDLVAAEHEVAAAIEVVLTPNEFSALVSWQFNTGAIDSSGGTKCINENKFQEAWDNHYCLYIHDASGNALPGLVRRRAAERALFFTP
jgi:lysozyme